MVARRVGIRFFIRCIYCSIISSVARDKRSQPNLSHLHFASINPAHFIPATFQAASSLSSSFTPVTYMGKLQGTHYVAALLQLEIQRV